MKVRKLIPFQAPSCLLIAVVLSSLALGESTNARVGPVGSEVSTQELASKLLKRSVKYRVTLPVRYKSLDKERFPVIYLLHGLFGHFDNWTDKTKLAEYVAPFDFIIVMPEGGDGWYTDSVSAPDDKFESYIVQELIPEIDGKFRTIADRSHRYIAGLSMGGYGAIKFGIKYPKVFSLVGSFSGALDAPLRGQDNKNLRPSVISVFGTDESPVRRENDIFRLLRETSGGDLISLPYIYFACGTEDFLFEPNREFDALLLEKKVPHEYRELPGDHNWVFWDAQVQEFLRVADRRLRMPGR